MEIPLSIAIDDIYSLFSFTLSLFCSLCELACCYIWLSLLLMQSGQLCPRGATPQTSNLDNLYLNFA